MRRKIGLTGQKTAVDDLLTARQNLTMFGRLFRLDKRAAGRRADELLEVFNLADSADRTPKNFSGGMRRRLDLAASMILAPSVLFLDEPTTGSIPRGAPRGVAGGPRPRRARHHRPADHALLDEADRLCDRISVIDDGRNLIEDTPAGLTKQIGDERLEIVAADEQPLGPLADLLAPVAGSEPVVSQADHSVSAPVPDPIGALTTVATEVRRLGLQIEDLGLRRPTLDEAFLHLTSQERAA